MHDVTPWSLIKILKIFIWTCCHGFRKKKDPFPNKHCSEISFYQVLWSEILRLTCGCNSLIASSGSTGVIRVDSLLTEITEELEHLLHTYTLPFLKSFWLWEKKKESAMEVWNLIGDFWHAWSARLSVKKCFVSHLAYCCITCIWSIGCQTMLVKCQS